MSNLSTLDINNFAKGAAVELFERELTQVMENIADENTKAETARTITLTFTLKPDIDREQAALTVESKSKLAPIKQAAGQTVFGRKNGRLTAYCADINDWELNQDSKPELVSTAKEA